jgi:hypothetical protein
MKYLLPSGALAFLLITAQPAIASSPAIEGEISGVEVCIQSVCGAAIFTGTCDCTVRGRAAPGLFWVTVQYDELPDVNQAAAIRRL